MKTICHPELVEGCIKIRKKENGKRKRENAEGRQTADSRQQTGIRKKGEGRRESVECRM
ncbi:MAG: hypothetical protein V1779_02115 [bacterium]